MLAYNSFELIASAAAAIEPYLARRDELPDNWVSTLTDTQRAALDRFIHTLDIATFNARRDFNAHYGR